MPRYSSIRQQQRKLATASPFTCAQAVSLDLIYADTDAQLDSKTRTLIDECVFERVSSSAV